MNVPCLFPAKGGAILWLRGHSNFLWWKIMNPFVKFVCLLLSILNFLSENFGSTIILDHVTNQTGFIFLFWNHYWPWRGIKDHAHLILVSPSMRSTACYMKCSTTIVIDCVCTSIARTPTIEYTSTPSVFLIYLLNILKLIVQYYLLTLKNQEVFINLWLFYPYY